MDTVSDVKPKNPSARPPGRVYRHTQFGLATVGVLAAGLAFIGWQGLSSGWDPVLVLACGVLLLCLLFFHSLTVTVDRAQILLRFGSGPIRRRYVLSDVRSAAPVRSRWWHGYGIRWIPGGVLYAVSGLDAVELTFSNGRVVRIGTDEPQALYLALEKRLRNRS